MQVILLSDVKSVGKRDEIVKLSDGYARNFIIKKGLGVEANKQSLYELEQRKEKERQEAKQLLDEAKEKKAEIEKVLVKLKIKLGDNGKSFGSISGKEISEGLLEQHKIDIDKRKLVLDNVIKTTGDIKVPVKLHSEITADLRVLIEEE